MVRSFSSPTILRLGHDRPNKRTSPAKSVPLYSVSHVTELIAGNMIKPYRADVVMSGKKVTSHQAITAFRHCPISRREELK